MRIPNPQYLSTNRIKMACGETTGHYDALLANQEETIKSQIKWLGYIKIGTDRMTKLINIQMKMGRLM